MQKGLGCFSRSGILAAVVTLAAVTGLIWLYGGAIFSPGSLNAQTGEAALGGVQSHAELTNNCVACHPAPWSRVTMANRCLECHTEVAEQLQRPQSLHGKVLSPDNPLTCRGCHTEHQGITAALTIIDPDSFPHETVGYSLQGHRQTANGNAFTCEHCHRQNLAQFELPTCDTCHRDSEPQFILTHVETFGRQCLACHDGIDTYGSDFDHNSLAFPLQGKHAPLACNACHQQAQSIADLQSAPQECYACHRQDDVHDGGFGQDCAACHTASDWADAAIDHSLTNFPLIGAHTQVACEACHLDNVFAGTPQECSACHIEPEFHVGLFNPTCDECHIEDAWSPARYNQPHTFPINHGEQGMNTCQTCHPANLQTYTCYECHEHTPAKVERKHLEEGIREFQNCVECHPTGREEEGGQGGSKGGS